jgi:hypothetical protein
MVEELVARTPAGGVGWVPEHYPSSGKESGWGRVRIAKQRLVDRDDIPLNHVLWPVEQNCRMLD